MPKRATPIHSIESIESQPIESNSIPFPRKEKKREDHKFFPKKEKTLSLFSSEEENLSLFPELDKKAKEDKEKVRQERNIPKYTESFSNLWKIHPYGSKKAAFLMYQKVFHILPMDCENILRRQVEWVKAAPKGEFRASLPHLERWFRHHRWEDYIPENTRPARPVN